MVSIPQKPRRDPVDGLLHPPPEGIVPVAGRHRRTPHRPLLPRPQPVNPIEREALLDPAHRPLIIAGGAKTIYEPWDVFGTDAQEPWGADVAVTGEFVVTPLEGKVDRTQDDSVGLKLWCLA